MGHDYKDTAVSGHATAHLGDVHYDNSSTSSPWIISF
jgi:hypothetical protein